MEISTIGKVNNLLKSGQIPFANTHYYYNAEAFENLEDIQLDTDEMITALIDRAEFCKYHANRCLLYSLIAKRCNPEQAKRLLNSGALPMPNTRTLYVPIKDIEIIIEKAGGKAAIKKAIDNLDRNLSSYMDGSLEEYMLFCNYNTAEQLSVYERQEALRSTKHPQETSRRISKMRYLKQ